MAKNLAGSCSMCRNYFGVVIDKKAQRIHAVCATSAYEIDWALIRS